jgi:hypothetical protein
MQTLALTSLIILFILNLFIFWPGQVSPDSLAQLKEALAGTYTDPNPPIMAIVWHYLLFIFPYTTGMLIFHLTLLYSSCFIFFQAFKKYKVKYFYLIYPLLPPILFYSSSIWKDVGFAFAYLFVGASTTYFAMHKKRPSTLQLAGITLILFYGTAAKFQAVYCAPFMLMGICYILNNFKLNLKTLLYTIIAQLALLVCINQFNSFVVTTEKKSDYWKYVKIYDLAGMSIELDQPIFPEYILEYKNFSFSLIKEKFNYERVDDIVFFKDSPIPRKETENDQVSLLKKWQHAVVKHPVAYLKHRYKNWRRLLFTKPLEKLEKLDFNSFGGLKWFASLQNKKSFLSQLIFFTLGFIRYIFSFIFVFIFMLCYLALGIFKRRETLGVILIILNGAALMMVLALYFLSMASLLRYVYISVCLVHASHPIAYLLIKRRCS